MSQPMRSWSRYNCYNIIIDESARKQILTMNTLSNCSIPRVILRQQAVAKKSHKYIYISQFSLKKKFKDLEKMLHVEYSRGR